MKASELMIGDWVLYNETPQQILEISGIDDEVYLETDELVHQSEIQPIPLTAEILEKNGFVNDRGIYCWRDENKQITYFSKENNRPYCTYSFVNIESGCIVVDELPIEYVHELQHTLRLCGIKIEIEL